MKFLRKPIIMAVTILTVVCFNVSLCCAVLPPKEPTPQPAPDSAPESGPILDEAGNPIPQPPSFIWFETVGAINLSDKGPTEPTEDVPPPTTVPPTNCI